MIFRRLSLGIVVGKRCAVTPLSSVSCVFYSQRPLLPLTTRVPLASPYTASPPTLLTQRFHYSRLRTNTTATTASSPTLWESRRDISFDSILQRLGRSKGEKVKVDPAAFDKETTHYAGKLFGLPADDVVFYAKVALGTVTILFIMYIVFKGYVLLSNFSLQAVARMGFFGGFITCFLGYSITLNCIRRCRINPNAVYNQSIALVMKNEKVQQFLGSHPRTGEFKTYSETGGFKLPLLRRIRSGSYELSDLLGLKPRRLQMLFVLKHPSSSREGLVSCDVVREGVGPLSSTNVYTSLAITLTEQGTQKQPETIIIIGKPEDLINRSFLR